MQYFWASPNQPGTRGQTESLFAIRLLYTILFAVAISGIAQAQEGCSNIAAAGNWGLTTTGTVLLPSGAVQVAIVGRFTLDVEGNLAGTQTRSLNGVINRETFRGTINVNPDCTATATIDVFHEGILNRTATLDLVFVSNWQAFRGVFTSAVAQPSGTSISTVLLMDGQRIDRTDVTWRLPSAK